MARSTREFDVAEAPPDGSFAHSLSGRQYSVYRKEGRLWHREELSAGDGADDGLLLNEHPLKYVVGSGSSFAIYLAEIDGFLVESPITWYADKPGWDVSPGYDVPVSPGFERAVTEVCLMCHTGQAQAVEGSWHRMHISEPSIGCERCHGPGALHVARWDGRLDEAEFVGDRFDRTIVNPKDLSRDLADAVCHRCHLTTKAYVTARGRDMSQFRPGLPREAFREFYHFRGPIGTSGAVGHSEQMFFSRCYRESESLACITCHNPHDTGTAEESAARYRAVCGDCHAADACGVAAEVRAAQSPANDCLVCHMPRVPTDVLHVAMTQHRIGIHPAAAAESSAGSSDDPGVAGTGARAVAFERAGPRAVAGNGVHQPGGTSERAGVAGGPGSASAEGARAPAVSPGCRTARRKAGCGAYSTVLGVGPADSGCFW
ncbi:MAG: hypothetical protein KY476_05650 [Planctomycetes bacterium]|nr:hypothetical protein [Planctomycetota bacterium]